MRRDDIDSLLGFNTMDTRNEFPKENMEAMAKGYMAA